VKFSSFQGLTEMQAAMLADEEGVEFVGANWEVQEDDIASGNFTTGDKYLILAMAQLGVDTSFKVVYTRIVHGSTAFDDSEQLWANSASTRRTPYFWWTVWTPVSGEDVNIQYRGNANNVPTASLDFIVLLAINLSDDVTKIQTGYMQSEAQMTHSLLPSLMGQV
jgi:hypothetical protein